MILPLINIDQVVNNHFLCSRCNDYDFMQKYALNEI